MERLNPYSNGMRGGKIMKKSFVSAFVVLILILMECAAAA